MHVSRRAAGLLFLAVSSCATYRDQLGRGHRAFEASDHDHTLAILRNLEPDMGRLSIPEQAEYAYLRGMTDYRIGYKADARHWLAIARAHEDRSPGVLAADWKARVSVALDELNGLVYSEGTSALTTSHAQGGARDGETSSKDRKGTKRETATDVPSSAP